MNAGEILDRVIRANYRFLCWLAICALLAAIAFAALMLSMGRSFPDWILASN